MILSFEGPPAAGKSTISKALADNQKAFVIPEVNLLFDRPDNVTENWFLSRQVERWEIGIKEKEKYEWIIFDGDLFQPLWFNWIFEDEGWPTNYNEHFLSSRFFQVILNFQMFMFFYQLILRNVGRENIKEDLK